MFLFQKSLISFLCISVKSNNYKIIIETQKRLSIWISYLLFEPNNALRAFTTDPELQFQISIPKGKIV